jgi:hypothetical protein
VANERPTSTPGERRLERPPSDRYRPAPSEPEPGSGATGSLGRAIAFGGAAAIGGAVAITIAGGLIAITAGLLVIAAVVGWVVAGAVTSGARVAVPRSTVRWLAVVLAVAGVALGQVGLWLLGREEGGVLSLIDYLAEVFGFLVPLQFGIAALVAWWQTR